MTHRERYAEACRKAFEGVTLNLPEYSGTPKVKRNRVPSNNSCRKWSRAEAEQLVDYCCQGLRSFEIAELMGRSPKAIQKAFVRFGFPSLQNICPPCGEDNPAWNGGVHIAHNGYRFLRRPDHPQANQAGYVQEHRLVVEEHLGRYLLPTEVVHHIDGNPANNSIENLELFSTNGEHLRATLTGVRHHISEEGHRILSEKTKKAWRDPNQRNSWQKAMRNKPHLRKEDPKVASIRFS